ncbi:MAG: L-fucose/L-arabinose isomerase family protein [Verrucomicrobia bacterium]|nr:L-fucose/L-arabinose isomerase family protein [Verrucomicrobiota bacterium]
MNRPITLGVIIGNRDFFPDVLVTQGRQDILEVLTERGIGHVILDERSTKFGGVETWQDAKKCAALFDEHRQQINGILVVLPNFGDEKGVADSIKLSGLKVPILVQAYPDDLSRFSLQRRRDAFCGKISVCNNFYQYGIPFSITKRHTVLPKSDPFKADLDEFVAVCRVVDGMKQARLGAVGARPNAFNTTRYSEKLLQAFGISVSCIDLSEVFGRAEKIGDQDKSVTERLEGIRAYVPTSGIPPAAMTKMAKLGIVLDDWMRTYDLHASAIQCWDSLQHNYGVNVCTLMSMMSENLLPSACEVDVTGVASMYALQLASGKPSALVDWNNNYGDDPNKCVVFHCGNWAKSFFGEVKMANAEILATTLGTENTYGTVAGRTPKGPFSYSRITTDDRHGVIRAYVGDGQFVDDPLDTFGSRAVVEVEDLQGLMRYVCRQGFEHHAAMNQSHSAAVLHEAFSNYFGWETYRHEGNPSKVHLIA